MNKEFCQNEESVYGGRVEKQCPVYSGAGVAVHKITTTTSRWEIVEQQHKDMLWDFRDD